MSAAVIHEALSELESLSRTQAETELRAEWTESIDRLEAEAAAIARLLGEAATVRAGVRKSRRGLMLWWRLTVSASRTSSARKRKTAMSCVR